MRKILLTFLIFTISLILLGMPPRPGLWEKVYPNKEQRMQAKSLYLSLSRRYRKTGYTPQRFIEPKGQIKALVLLCDFDDNEATLGKSYFEDLLFSLNPANPQSMRDYYRENSYNQLDIIGDVNDWVRMDKSYSYYTAGQYGIGDYPTNCIGLAEDLVEKVDPYIDFSQYDSNGDGYVDILIIVHAGPGAESTGDPDDIWSTEWTVPTGIPTDDGVTIVNFTMNPEYHWSPGEGNVPVGIGVFAHELGHIFGMPDLYDRDMSSEGIGEWGIMSYGSWSGPNQLGTRPTHFCAWCKMQMGWINPINVTENQDDAEIPYVEGNDKVYRLWIGGALGDEYFLVVNRRKKGFDEYIPGQGILIWHIDETQGNNDDESHYMVALEQADGNYDLENANNKGDGTDPYQEGDAFTPDTRPSSDSYSGMETGVCVVDIHSGLTATADLYVEPSPVIGLFDEKLAHPSGEVAVLGLNLYESSGTDVLKSVTVKIEGVNGDITESDIQRVAIYANDGTARAQWDEEDTLLGYTETPNPWPYYKIENINSTIPASFSDGYPSYIIVVTLSDTCSHGDSFKVLIEAGGIEDADNFGNGNPHFDTASGPSTPPVVRCDIIDIVNFTQRDQRIDMESPPTVVLGLNGWCNDGKDNRIKKITLTIYAESNWGFDKTDLNPLALNDPSSGVALYRDGVGASGDGIFEPEVDELIPLSQIYWEDSDDPNEYRVVLVPQTPLEIYTDDTTTGYVGSDYFIVIRTSNSIFDFDRFKVMIKKEDIKLEIDGVEIPSQRQIPLPGQQTPPYKIYARPNPRAILTDLTDENQTIPRKSLPFAVIGINLRDNSRAFRNSFGGRLNWAVEYHLDENGEGREERVLDAVILNFIDEGNDGQFDPSVDLNALVDDNNTVDAEYEKRFTGVTLYIDDDTEAGDGIDNDGDGLIDEELRNRRDDDGDGTIDEDCGDGDPAGVNGVFDVYDDPIPLEIFHKYVSYAASKHSYMDPRTSGPKWEGNQVILRLETKITERHYIYQIKSDPWTTGPKWAFLRCDHYPMVKPDENNYTSVSRGKIVGYEKTGRGIWIDLGSWPRDDEYVDFTYSYVIYIPDDDEGVNHGDDFFVVIRTSNSISHGDDFRVEVPSGGIRYSTWRWNRLVNNWWDHGEDGGWGLFPGSLDNNLTSHRMVAINTVECTLEKFTTSGQRIDATSPPTPVIGINLNDDYSDEYLQKVRVHFWDNEGDGKFTLEDLADLVNNESSGVALYIDDPDSDTPGKFDDPNDPAVNHPDIFVPSSFNVISNPPEYIVEIVPNTSIPMPDDDIGDNAGSDVFVVIRTSDKIDCGDDFYITMDTEPPPGEDEGDVVVTSFITSSEITTDVITGSVPVFLTDLTPEDDPTIGYSSPPYPVIGINIHDATGTEKLRSITLTFYNYEGDEDFTPDDLESMDHADPAENGVAIYRDNPTSGQRGIFEPDVDIPLPILETDWGGLTPGEYTITLELQTPEDLPLNDLDLGNDYFIVIRTSDNISLGDDFYVSIPSGGIVFTPELTSGETISTRVITSTANYPPNITVTSPPAGGVTASQSFRIEWEDFDAEDDATITLYYDTDNDYSNGGYTFICGDISEDDETDAYNWDISQIPPGDYYILAVIDDGVNPPVYDYSDGVLTIINQPPTINIVEPDGEDDYADNSFLIQWSDEDPDNNAVVRIYYDTDDSGYDGQLIVETEEDPDEAGDTYTWDTSGFSTGAQFWIYGVIDDGINPPVTTPYSGPITVVHEYLAKINYPNGGEVLQGEVDISYSVFFAGAETLQVTLEYSYDGGRSWEEIDTFTTTNGDDTYTWDTTLFPDSTQALIRITVTDGVSVREDTSDSYFTVDNTPNETPLVKVLYPNGDEKLRGTVNIEWYAIEPDDGDQITGIDIEYSSDNGMTWNYIAQNVANTGVYAWDTTEVPDGDDYLIRITAYDNDGVSQDESDSSFTIDNINEKPQIIQFNANTLSGTAPLTVEFNFQVQDPDGKVVKVEMDFDGKGIFDWEKIDYYGITDGKVTHVYNEAGEFHPVLRIMDEEGEYVESTLDITVTGDFTVDLSASTLTGTPPLVVTFVATPSKTVEKYEWDFNGDGIYDLTTLSPKVVYSFDAPGVYSVYVRVTDYRGLATSDNLNIIVSEIAEEIPHASLSGTSPTLGNPPLEVNFNGSYSSDPDGVIEMFYWDFLGRGRFNLQGDYPTPTNSLGEIGIYYPRLKVTDNEGYSNFVQDLEITVIPPEEGEPLPPIIESFEVEYSDTELLPLTVNFSALASSPQADVYIQYYFLDFEGDGIFDYVTTDTGPINLSHTYTQVGYYWPYLMVIDSEGLWRIERSSVPVIVKGEERRVDIIYPVVNTTVGGIVPIIPYITPNIDVASVWGEYKEEGAPYWIKMENETATFPYGLEWDTSSLPDGTYEIRVEVKDTNDNVFPSPPLLLTVNNTSPRVYGVYTQSGYFALTSYALSGEGIITFAPDGTGAYIPLTAFSFVDENTYLYILGGSSIERTINIDYSNVDDLGIYREFTVYNGVLNNSPFYLFIPYPDENQDGYVDGTSVEENTIIPFYFDGATWRRVQDYYVDTARNVVVLEMNHLSIFGLGAPTPPAPPAHFKVEAGDSKVKLSWSVDPQKEGVVIVKSWMHYHYWPYRPEDDIWLIPEEEGTYIPVERKGEIFQDGVSPYDSPNSDHVDSDSAVVLVFDSTNGTYVDEDVENGNTYYYAFYSYTSGYEEYTYEDRGRATPTVGKSAGVAAGGGGGGGGCFIHLLWRDTRKRWWF
ncbi:M6 family metalloprotease domain-containing protein [Candidatus Calescamantes bacterium]|nr:M6 family metalloprotease domain-containing protein [Candidatus Calescamantes bacterium]